MLNLNTSVDITSVTVTVNQGLTLSNGTVDLIGYINSNGIDQTTLQLAGSGTQTLGGTGQVIFSSTQSTTDLMDFLTARRGRWPSARGSA